MDTGNISSGATTFDNFKSNKAVNGTKDFLESNSLIAKIAFLLLVLVAVSYTHLTLPTTAYV